MDAKEAGFYAAFLILGVIITYFIVSIIRQQRRSLQLYKQSIYTEITTLERERARMAADLHDEVGPVLSAVKLRLNSMDLTDAEDRKELVRTNEQIDNLMRRMREISFDLMPNSLLRKGLPEAISEFIEYCSKSSPLTIRSQFEKLPLSRNQSINLYRILQEIIHNTIKHAQATDLKIEMRQEKKGIMLLTQDNGIGFNYDPRSGDSKGMGLRNLLSRTEIIGGKMYVESKKGKGTTFTFEIPIKDNEVNNTDTDPAGR
ncbi:MAG TPA: sensor histidine kinase [Flavitalea sp.]|nr:sensor histidine kinase [Flavitalea sp.]